MMTNNDIKEIKSLSQSKFRQKYNKFVAEGHKSCIELLQQSKINILQVFYLDAWQDYLHLVPDEVESYRLDSKSMSRISSLVNPPDVLVVGEIDRKPYNPIAVMDGFALYLDRIQDPGNVGTILRIADWYGIGTVIRNSGTADWYHPKVVQASMGSLSALHLLDDVEDAILDARCTIYGAFLDGEPISSISWQSTGILILGNEGKGISTQLETKVTEKIYIPGSSNRTAESLNVAVATGVLCNSLFASLDRR